MKHENGNHISSEVEEDAKAYFGGLLRAGQGVPGGLGGEEILGEGLASSRYSGYSLRAGLPTSTSEAKVRIGA